MAARGTRATQELARLGIAHSVHEYSHREKSGSSGSYGLAAAAALGVPAGQLNLKSLAEAAGGKRAEMAEPAAAERATGYVTGGISPIAQRKRLPVVVDTTALDWPAVYCSAGQRGLQVRLAPDDLIRATGAVVAPIARAGG